MVYQLLDERGLCQYYQLNDHPGINLRLSVRKDKFAFLDEEKMNTALVSFKNETETHTTLYLPQIHCSSCLYLLENLHRLEPGVIASRIDFTAKKISVVFRQQQISLRQVVELLASLGYEPYISLHDLGQSRPGLSRSMVYQLGVAGFCFGNIMLLCFPEYLGLKVSSDASDKALQTAFRYISFVLALPILFYSSIPFYRSAWGSLRRGLLNIDAPIVLAIWVTFSRSVWEVLSGTGSGYFDSMSGIVFFMLAGRVLQDKTYRQLSFERDYTAYFPMAVSIVAPAADSSRVGVPGPTVKALPDIRSGDTLLIHNGELIPADGILTRGKALIDYSFVTGESAPVAREIGELVYAGGRQTGSSIEVLVVKEVVQSYLTQLWDRQEKPAPAAPLRPSLSETASSASTQTTRLRASAPARSPFALTSSDILSRYFTYVLFTIAALTAVFWAFHDPARIASAVTAVLIVACPCALLLSTTFTNGNLLRILSRNQCYLRNAPTIERIAATTHIVFDKTGTLTDSAKADIFFEGKPLSPEDKNAIAAIASQSLHPHSKALAAFFTGKPEGPVSHFLEIPGKGLEGYFSGHHIRLGSSAFITGNPDSRQAVHIAIDGKYKGVFRYANHYREGIGELVCRLPMPCSVLSGDTDREKQRLKEIFGPDAELLFHQSPADKERYISQLQAAGKQVLFIGDGLNDAGALRQSNVGIALSSDNNTFTPASDVILNERQLWQLPAFIRLCRSGHRIILASFIVSILYNIVGLSFAVRGELSPLVAAILMPASSLSILLLTYSCSGLAGRLLLRKSAKPATPDVSGKRLRSSATAQK